MEGFNVEKISSKIGKEFIREKHYSKSCHNGPMCWGLMDKDGNLRGVCAFATPCSENVRASIFGPQDKHRVTELHRLWTDDDLPDNATSWFVTRAIKGLQEYRPDIRAIISFADGTEGHTGAIYKALNFHDCGATGRARFYRDSSGALRHPRQNGVNIDSKEAKRRGRLPEMRDAKHRFLLIVGNTPTDKRVWTSRAKILTPH